MKLRFQRREKKKRVQLAVSMNRITSIGTGILEILLPYAVVAAITSVTKQHYGDSTHGYAHGPPAWAVIGALVAMLASG